MADLVIAPADVQVVQGAANSIDNLISGEAVAAGEAVYLDTTDLFNGRGKAKKADCSQQPSAVIHGIAINSAPGPMQPLQVLRAGQFTASGTTMNVGQVYVVSTNGGGIAPIGDLIATNYVSLIGIAIATNTFELGINVSGVQQGF